MSEKRYIPSPQKTPLPQLLHTRKSAALRLFGDPRKIESIMNLEEAGLGAERSVGSKMSTVYIPDADLVALVGKKIYLPGEDQVVLLPKSEV